MPDDIGLFEAIHSQRGIRFLKPDTVPDELIRKILEAAIRAPNGANLQRWAFMVVKDAEQRRKVAACYQRVQGPTITPDMPAQIQRNFRAGQHLAQHLHEAPVFIIPCVVHDGSPGDWNRGATIFPAIQNILLAARGLGLGGSLTTRHKAYESEVKEILGIPENVDTAALLPIGYPVDGHRYGPTTRKPVEEVAYTDKWGNNFK